MRIDDFGKIFSSYGEQSSKPKMNVAEFFRPQPGGSAPEPQPLSDKTPQTIAASHQVYRDVGLNQDTRGELAGIAASLVITAKQQNPS